MSHNCSHETASSSAECSQDKPPFSFVRGQDSTMSDIVWVSPQGHRSVSVSRHFLLQAPQCPCSVQKRFSRDHCCRGRSKPVVCCMLLNSIRSSSTSSMHSKLVVSCTWFWSTCVEVSCLCSWREKESLWKTPPGKCIHVCLLLCMAQMLWCRWLVGGHMVLYWNTCMDRFVLGTCCLMDQLELYCLRNDL